MKALFPFLTAIIISLSGCASKPFQVETQTKVVKDEFYINPDVFYVPSTPFPKIKTNQDTAKVKQYIKDILSENITLRDRLSFIKSEIDKYNQREVK